jgi:hypothetical protein
VTAIQRLTERRGDAEKRDAYGMTNDRTGWGEDHTGSSTYAAKHDKTHSIG